MIRKNIIRQTVLFVMDFFSTKLGRYLLQLTSIKDGSELLLFGGNSVMYPEKIWNFNFAENGWKEVGSMFKPRFGHVVLKVDNLKC